MKRAVLAGCFFLACLGLAAQANQDDVFAWIVTQEPDQYSWVEVYNQSGSTMWASFWWAVYDDGCGDCDNSTPICDGYELGAEILDGYPYTFWIDLDYDCNGEAQGDSVVATVSVGPTRLTQARHSKLVAELE